MANNVKKYTYKCLMYFYHFQKRQTESKVNFRTKMFSTYFLNATKNHFTRSLLSYFSSKWHTGRPTGGGELGLSCAITDIYGWNTDRLRGS